MSILDRRIFMKRWSGLFQRGAVSTITVEIGKTSFHLCSQLKAYQTYTSAKTMRWKHTWIKKKKTNETISLFIVWGFTAFKSSSDILSKRPYVYPLILIGFSHPHSPPAAYYEAAPCEAEGFYVGLQGFTTCGQPAISLETLALPAPSRLAWNTMLKDIGVDFPSVFKGGGLGMVRWDSLEVWGIKFCNG